MISRPRNDRGRNFEASKTPFDLFWIQRASVAAIWQHAKILVKRNHFLVKPLV
jgi:hypothetical protein